MVTPLPYLTNTQLAELIQSDLISDCCGPGIALKAVVAELDSLPDYADTEPTKRKLLETIAIELGLFPEETP